MFRPWPILIPVFFVVGACGSGAPEPEHDFIRSESWPEVMETGFVVAPVAGLNLLDAAADPTAFFTEEFFAALQQSLPGTPLVSPDEMFSRLDGAGTDAHARLRSLRRRLVREEKLDAAELTTLSHELQQKFLLVAWLDEGIEEGINKTNLDDYQAFTTDMEVHRFPTDELHGSATAMMLDLERAEVIFRGAVDYESVGLEGTDGGIRREVERTRAAAAIRLADRISGISPR